MTGYSPLRQALLDAGGDLADLTVLAPRNDPFRVDTPSRHRDGQWLAAQLEELGLGSRSIHLRGLHYALIGRPKPNGMPYVNTAGDFQWLIENAAKAARWLGYVPFAQITDERNAEPRVQRFEAHEPFAYLLTEIVFEIDSGPAQLTTVGFDGVQPYRLVLVGEKSSLESVLGPIAEAYQADLYLPSGEISERQAHDMALDAQADGRPLVVFYFSDCDPAGWQMPISLSRKLQAHKALLPALPHFEVHRVALTPAQVEHYGLPSTPLKDSEHRADRWREMMGVQQTEIDALATLRPTVLDEIAREALEGFYDTTLAERVRQYTAHWRDEAWARVRASTGYESYERAYLHAEERLAEMREEVERLNRSLRLDIDHGDLPEIAIPEARDPGGNGCPLVDSRWAFPVQCRALKDAKAYEPADDL